MTYGDQQRTGTVINGLYSLVNLLIDGIVLILPDFSIGLWLDGALSEFSPYLAVINYFVPFGLMIDIAAAWLGAVLIWYVVQFVLRFVQLGS